jgi:hypothetical protein
MGLRWAEALDCSSAEEAVALQAGLDSAQIQDPSPGEVLQEENREVRDPASPRPPVPPAEECSLQDEANPDSSLSPFDQLLTPPPNSRQCLKVYSHRRP